MKRFTSILMSIFLGALAVAIGMGIFLKKANDDRQRLADLAIKSQQQAKEAQQIREQAVQEANKKLDAANTEISKAEKLIATLREERALIATATILQKPSSREIRGWKETFNLSLGIGLKLPPGYEVQENDKAGLIVQGGWPQTSLPSQLADTRWLSILPYDEQAEQELLKQLDTSSSTSISYLIDGHVLIGKRATQATTGHTLFVAHVRSGDATSFLIWAREPAHQNRSPLTTALSTLDFRE